MTFPCLLCPLLTSATRSGNLAVPSVPIHRTRRRSPEVSSTAFRAQPPNLRPAPLIDFYFPIICPLLPAPPPRAPPCAPLPLPPHRAGGGPPPPKRANMLGIQKKPGGHDAPGP